MRSLVCAFVGLAASQDVFLSKSDLDLESSRRRRRSRSPVSKHDCVKQCLDGDEKHNFIKCNHDGSSSCANSKCCQLDGYTCFVKNAYWSACAKTCKKGVPDSLGETWDCTPLSPSDPKTLKPCVEKCWGSEFLLSSNQTVDVDSTKKWDCSAYASAKECKDVHCKTSNAALNKIWEKTCDENCPKEPVKKCPASSFTKCISNCGVNSSSPEHGDRCESDGRTSCQHSRCCQNPSDKCYTKNQYWAACASECKSGKVNPADGQVWDCHKLKPRKTMDPFLYRMCVSTCWSRC